MHSADQDPDWRDQKSYYKIDRPCMVCGATYRIGAEPRFCYFVCEKHSELSPVEITKAYTDKK
jgi:hypothetical protein